MKQQLVSKWGAFALLVFFAGLSLLFIGRFFVIQSSGESHGEDLVLKAAAQYERQSILDAKRGEILDRNGRIIAEDTQSYRLVATLDETLSQPGRKPIHVVDKEYTAEVLAKYLNATEEQILERLNMDRKQLEFGTMGRGLSYETKALIEEEELPGIFFYSDSKRYYPNGSFASFLIGYARSEEVKDEKTNAYKLRTEGQMGIEAYYDEILEGTDGYESFSADKKGYLLPGADYFVTEPEHGYNIKLTLDKTIENFVDDAMSRVNEKYSPEEMITVVADPKTGEILAMSQRPTFDPNTREELTNDSSWLNQATEDTLEPGSTMKIFTLATAIETGNWFPEAQYKSGQYQMPNSMRIVRDHNSVGWGTISFLEGIQRSSNVAIAYMMERIGSKTYLDYLDRFGFGKQTGFTTNNEAAGVILNNNQQDIISTAFGQASTVTPIQLVQAMTAIANDGVMMKPYVVDEIVNPNNGKIVEQHEPEETGTPISPETAEQVKDILASTVTVKHGTAKQFAIDNYTVAGKTGTAQIVNENGTYDWGADEFLYSFLGMAPVEDPQLIVYVAVQKPKLEGKAGSTPVAEVFTSVMENSLKYLNIDPANTVSAEKATMGDYVGKSAQTVQVELEAAGMHVAIAGEGGAIQAQYPQKEQTIVAGDRVFLQTEGATILPDFTGWSLRHILTFEQMANLNLVPIGQGYGVSQTVLAGTLMTGSTSVDIILQTPQEKYMTDETAEDVTTEPIEQQATEEEQQPSEDVTEETQTSNE